MPTKLTPHMQLALSLLQQQKRSGDTQWEGWGLMVTERQYELVDGQARIWYGTALGLQRRGLVVTDSMGRVKLR